MKHVPFSTVLGLQRVQIVLALYPSIWKLLSSNLITSLDDTAAVLASHKHVTLIQGPLRCFLLFYPPQLLATLADIIKPLRHNTEHARALKRTFKL